MGKNALRREDFPFGFVFRHRGSRRISADETGADGLFFDRGLPFPQIRRDPAIFRLRRFFGNIIGDGRFHHGLFLFRRLREITTDETRADGFFFGGSFLFPRIRRDTAVFRLRCFFGNIVGDGRFHHGLFLFRRLREITTDETRADSLFFNGSFLFPQKRRDPAVFRLCRFFGNIIGDGRFRHTLFPFGRSARFGNGFHAFQRHLFRRGSRFRIVGRFRRRRLRSRKRRGALRRTAAQSRGVADLRFRRWCFGPPEPIRSVAVCSSGRSRGKAFRSRYLRIFLDFHIFRTAAGTKLAVILFPTFTAVPHNILRNHLLFIL